MDHPVLSDNDSALHVHITLNTILHFNYLDFVKMILNNNKMHWDWLNNTELIKK